MPGGPKCGAPAGCICMPGGDGAGGGVPVIAWFMISASTSPKPSSCSAPDASMRDLGLKWVLMICATKRTVSRQKRATSAWRALSRVPPANLSLTVSKA